MSLPSLSFSVPTLVFDDAGKLQIPQKTRQKTQLKL